MTRKLKTIALCCALLASLAFAGSVFLAPPPADAGCIVICDGGWCPPGKVSGYDYCTGAHVCSSVCLSP